MAVGRQIGTLGCLLVTLVVSAFVNAVEFKHKLDGQVRADARSDRDYRTQYRFRYTPRLILDEAKSWSLNGFVVTGDAYRSEHNVAFDGESDHLYLRHLFLRKEYDGGKTEVGVIPGFKGRISSSGLSKYGWISGVRQVVQIKDNSALEIVVGELDFEDPADAIAAPKKLDYFEAEYSAGFGERHSYEISLERMAGGNFARGEYRYQVSDEKNLFLEYIHRLDITSSTSVVGMAGERISSTIPLYFFVHYSYISEDFGPRAELTEDFLGTGHGFSAEVGNDFEFDDRYTWFVRYDVVDSTSRLLVGVDFKIL